MRKFWISICASTCLSVSVTGANQTIDTTKGYVVATSINLREEPTSDSKVIIVLPIATPVKFVEHMRGDDFESSWSKVEVTHGPHLGKLGWVSAKYIDFKRPTIESLMGSHDSELPCNFKSRGIWLDRAMALDPTKAAIAIKSREINKQAIKSGTQTVLIATSDGGCCRTEATFDTARLSFEKFCELVNTYYYKKSAGSYLLDHTEWNRLHTKFGITQRSSCPSEC